LKGFDGLAPLLVVIDAITRLTLAS
jgi:hypothetical protein